MKPYRRVEDHIVPVSEMKSLWSLFCGAMHAVLKVALLVAIFSLPQAAAAQGAEIPVPLCFEQAEEGAVRVRSRDGGQFQVIPPGGLDDQLEYFLEAVVRPGATVKLAGVQFQQFIEILAIQGDGVRVKNSGWARFLGEFNQVKSFPYGCDASAPAQYSGRWFKSNASPGEPEQES